MMPQHQVNWETNKEKKIWMNYRINFQRESENHMMGTTTRNLNQRLWLFFFYLCCVVSYLLFDYFFSFPLNIFLLLIFLFPHLNIGIVTYFTGIWLRPQLAFGQPFGTRSLGSATTGGCRYATMLTGSGSDVTRDPLPFWRNWYRLLWWRRR